MKKKTLTAYENSGKKMDKNQKEGKWLEMDPEIILLPDTACEAEKSIIPRSLIYEMCTSHLQFSVFSKFSKNVFYVFN